MSDLQTNRDRLETRVFGQRAASLTTVEIGAAVCEIILQGTEVMDEDSHHGDIARLGLPKGRKAEDQERLAHYAMADVAAEVSAMMHATRPLRTPAQGIDPEEMEKFRRVMLQRCAAAVTGVQELAARLLTDQELMEKVRQDGPEREPLPAERLAGIPFSEAVHVVSRFVGFHETAEGQTPPEWAYQPPSASL